MGESFEDAELAAAMEDYLVDYLMSWEQLDNLLKNPAYASIERALQAHPAKDFHTYWKWLGDWLGNHGGNISATSGQSVPGRSRKASALTGQQEAWYQDAFAQVQASMAAPGFDPVIAVRSQLLFAHAFAPRSGGLDQLPRQPRLGDRDEQR